MDNKKTAFQRSLIEKKFRERLVTILKAAIDLFWSQVCETFSERI